MQLSQAAGLILEALPEGEVDGLIGMQDLDGDVGIESPRIGAVDGGLTATGDDLPEHIFAATQRRARQIVVHKVAGQEHT